MAAEPQIEAQLEVLERGRYKVSEVGGSWIIARSVDTCERCQSCGCGEKADPITIPGFLIGMARQGGGLARIKEGLKGLTGRG